MRIVAREECGCSRRIGSVQKDSAVSAVAAWGTHPFSTPLCPPRRYHLKDREKDVQEEWQSRSNKGMGRARLRRGTQAARCLSRVCGTAGSLGHGPGKFSS
jgi:hypothetical protein